MHVRLFNWRRALDLAVQHRTHVDTVLYRRARYLEEAQRRETDESFKEYSRSVQVDEEAVLAKIAQEGEKEKERARPVGGGGGGGGGGGRASRDAGGTAAERAEHDAREWVRVRRFFRQVSRE